MQAAQRPGAQVRTPGVREPTPRRAGGAPPAGQVQAPKGSEKQVLSQLQRGVRPPAVQATGPGVPGQWPLLLADGAPL